MHDESLYAVVHRIPGTDRVFLVPFNDGLVRFAKALVGHGEQKEGDVVVASSLAQACYASCRVTERYARAYLSNEGYPEEAIHVCWQGVNHNQLHAFAAGVPQATEVDASEYEMKPHVIIEDPAFEPAFSVRINVAALPDWTTLSGYTLEKLVSDAATKAVGPYVLLARRKNDNDVALEESKSHEAAPADT